MKLTQKTLTLVIAATALFEQTIAQTSAVNFVFIASSDANYRQGPNGTAFEGAEFSFFVRDGIIIVDRPEICSAPFFFNPTQGCPLGSTGFISRGVDNDPLLEGLGPYFSVSNAQPAIALNPFEPFNARLTSAPPSLLPRPLLGFEDLGISLFFNLFTNNIRQFPVTTYNFEREYLPNERTRFDGEVVTGTYDFSFAALRRANSTSTPPPVSLSVNVFPKLDGFRRRNNVNQGLRFLNVSYDLDGFALIDPFALNTIRWEGNTSSFVSPNLDDAFFSIKPLSDPNNPLSEVVEYNGLGDVIEVLPGVFLPNPTIPLFPNFAGPFPARVTLPSPLDNNYVIPPGFLTAGETGVVDLEFTTFRPTSGIIYEEADRRFRLPVRVMNPFQSAINFLLPSSATALQKSADYDFDGDGISNFNEWVFGSDPSKAGSVPTMPSVKVTAPTVVAGASTDPKAAQTAAASASQSGLEFTVPKLTNTVPRLDYAIEYSQDMVNWSVIRSDDPNWILTNTTKELKVVSAAGAPNSGGFFRARVQVAN